MAGPRLACSFFTSTTRLRQSVPFLAQLTKSGQPRRPAVLRYIGVCDCGPRQKVFSRPMGPSNRFLRRRFLRIFPTLLGLHHCHDRTALSARRRVVLQVRTLQTGQAVLRDCFSASEWIQTITLTKIFMGRRRRSAGTVFSPINSVYWTLAIEFQFLSVRLLRVAVSAIISVRSFWASPLVSLTLIIFPMPLNAGLFIHFLAHVLPRGMAVLLFSGIQHHPGGE